MSVEMRSIRCHHFRVTREPCLNPAVVEVLGPVPKLLCAEHASRELDSGPGWRHLEGWEEHGAEGYARLCERALDALTVFDKANGADGSSAHNPVLELILGEAITYLEEYELERARGVLEERGGNRVETLRETEMREGLAKLRRRRAGETGD